MSAASPALLPRLDAARATLCSLVIQIHGAIAGVAANAAAARMKVSSCADAPDLAAEIEAAQIVKTTALEEEAVAVDAILERLEQAQAAVEASGDDSATLLEALLADVGRLPTSPVEPSDIDVVTGGDGLPTVAAPRGVLASHVDIACAPSFATPGAPLLLHLALNGAYPSRLPQELSIASAALARHLRIDATAVGIAGSTALPLPISVEPRACGVLVSIAVPLEAGSGAEVVVHGLCVSGSPVPASALPLHVRVTRGMIAPLVLAAAASDCSAAPAITPSGRLYAPDSTRATVLVFAHDGSSLAPLLVSAIGLGADGTRAAAWVEAAGTGDAAGPSLLLSDRKKLLALDPETRRVRWETEATGRTLRDSMGIAPLSSDFVAVTSYSGREIHVRRLADGARVSVLECASPSYVSHDPLSGLTFASISEGIVELLWDGSTLSRGDLQSTATPDGSHYRLLACFPPSAASSRLGSYLLVAAWRGSELRVVSLPDRALVHVHTLEGLAIVSLTVDPTGCALAVGDSNSRAIHVLPWPLAGFPPELLQ